MKLRQPLLAALVIIACGHELPSATPLGGKLDDGFSGGYTPDRRPRTDAGEATEVAESKEPESKESDAGASDAGLAKQDTADAGAADAATDAGPADASAKWAGEYVGSDLTVTRERGKPELSQPDPKARTRVEEKGGSRIAIIILNSASGETLCTLNAATRGSSATIDKNQDCFSSEDTDVTVESGSAELRGDRLSLDLKATFENAAGDEKREGTIDYHFDGKRQ